MPNSSGRKNNSLLNNKQVLLKTRKINVNTLVEGDHVPELLQCDECASTFAKHLCPACKLVSKIEKIVGMENH